MEKLQLGFLVSHGGTNMQAIIDATKNGYLSARPACVISNNSNAYGLERAKIEGIPNYHISDKIFPNSVDFDNAIINTFAKHNVNLIILAGYMKMISINIIKHFNGRILNIHPALLPKYGGKGMYGINVHKAVIDAGEKISGATIHVIDNEYDRGKILLQRQVPVLDNDTPDSLAARVLEVEHVIYSEAIKLIEEGKIMLNNE